MQREAVEALIQELPKFRLKAVPTDCSECPICLEEFHVGNEVNISLAHHIVIEILQFYRSYDPVVWLVERLAIYLLFCGFIRYIAILRMVLQRFAY